MQELVQKFYIGFYGRPAESEGLDYWVGRAEEKGWTSVRDAFATSEEAQEFVFQNPETGDEYSNQELINNIYQNLFGRDAEAEGREWYAEKLEAGEMTHSTIVHNIINGAQNEDTTVMNNKLDVAKYFTNNIDDKEYGEDQIIDARSVLEGKLRDVSSSKMKVDDLIDDLPNKTSNITLDELSGVYDMSDFTVDYDTGVTLNSDNVDSFDGEFTIYESGYAHQDVTIEGYTGFVEAQIEIIDDSTLNMESGGHEYELGYEYDGTKLTTYLEDIPAFPYDEIDYWTKTSDETPDQQIETLGVSSADFQNEIDFA